jgi:hypothetical protein
MSSNHGSFSVIVRKGRVLGEVEAVCFSYTKLTLVNNVVVKSFTAIKFPVETGEAKESPWETALNGVRLELSETPDSPEGFELRSLGGRLSDGGEPEPFLVSRTAGENGMEWHDKIVFLVLMNPDSVRRFRRVEKPDGPDEMLGVPEFVELSELWRRMYERGQPFHRAVLFQVMKYFVKKYPAEISGAYKRILSDPRCNDSMRSRGVPIRFNPDAGWGMAVQ